MAILSDYEDEDHKKPTTSAPPARKPFNAALDPSDPLRFMEKVFEFVARESDLFKSDSLVNDVNAVVRMVKDKVEAEDKKRKEVKIEGNGKAEKKVKEEVAPPLVKKEEMKREEVKESGSKAEEEKNGRRVSSGLPPPPLLAAIFLRARCQQLYAYLSLSPAPNKGNGLDLDEYSWGQSLQEVNITVPVPPGTKSRSIACEIKKNHLKVGLKGQPPIIDGELFQHIEVDDCFWSLEDQKPVRYLHSPD